jgi:rare lipoprotein A (peptidoglycan hydrolase)
MGLLAGIIVGRRWHPAIVAGKVNLASKYSEKGGMTARRDLSPAKLIAVHRTLPFGTNLSNGLTVVVRINAREPFKSRVIDLSQAAAEQLQFSELAPVSLEILKIAMDRRPQKPMGLHTRPCTWSPADCVFDDLRL